MAARMHDINPDMQLTVIKEFLTPDLMMELVTTKFDWVLDCIDSLQPKLYFLGAAATNGVKVASSMGAGGRVDPQKVRIAPIFETDCCRFAYKIRKGLRRKGFANANIIAGTQGAQTAGAVTLTVNGVAVAITATTDAPANRAVAAAAINNVAGQTGVTAEDNGDGLTLTAADGRNITLVASAATVGNTFGIDNVAITDGVTTYGSVTLSSGGQFTVAGGTNGNVNLEQVGFVAGTFGGAQSGQFLKDVDISTQKGANAALAAIDNALSSINSARADLGAIQNRFETTISNLAVSSENLTTSNSRIKDADFASEAASLARSQVLQQAGISVLSQANSGPEQVLALLR
jgi:flagellin